MSAAWCRRGDAPFAVLLDGDLEVTPRLRRQVEGCRSIAADGGIRHAAPLGGLPELWVGDFDSANSGHVAQYAAVPRQAFGREKDTTDGGLAILAALDRGATSIVLIGALGGRTDHSTAHLLQAFPLAQQGLSVVLTSGAEEALPLTNTPLRPGWPVGTTFSVLAFSDLEGLTLEGVRWPLSARDVPLGSTLTLSNVTESTLGAWVERGFAMLIARLCHKV